MKPIFSRSENWLSRPQRKSSWGWFIAMALERPRNGSKPQPGTCPISVSRPSAAWRVAEPRNWCARCSAFTQRLQASLNCTHARRPRSRQHASPARVGNGATAGRRDLVSWIHSAQCIVGTDAWAPMDFDGLDLNLLVALDALFAEKSVSRAGERLHLSQSATSGALARLRQAFHDPLLVQVGRRMTLTPLAEGLVEPVKEFLLHAETILNGSPVFDPTTSTRKFRVQMSDYVQTVVMTEALPRLQSLAPGISLELVWNIEGISEPLERGEIDLAVTPASYLSPGHPS